MLYSIKSYIDITISISWASSTCVSFVSHMQLVNGAQFLIIIFLLVLITGAAAAAMFWTELF